MTTVIVATDYGTAATVAARLGLGQSWYYPHDLEHIRGLAVTRVIYVEGWHSSRTLTPEVVTAVVARMTSGATEERVSWGDQFDMIVAAPFVEAVTPSARTIQAQHAQRRRRGIPAGAAMPIGLGIGALIAAGVLALLKALGWLP
jgi:hypothetical protein